ncbi:MAG: 5-deoxy-glucuronate isomerase [Rubrobacteraceae bacterium]|uniref:5-deoxy-glucuronate isomerase n=1 Tax=Rubrobacter naiadicus TaxID=1392641 RepID=UPI002362CE35|nr:5-deoxy-glucuronate isomerase [Rubrobacter naiadicus]MBX6763843.1 5-deoxy-glucuronate isomerase [Rubrobacteraceae bacterium]
MRLYFENEEPEGAVREVVNPDNSPSEGLELALVRADGDDRVELVDEGRESVLVILGGRCSVEVEGGGSWKELGERKDVFSGKATAVYVPAGTPYRISSQTGSEVAICRAPADGGGEAYVVRPGEVNAAVRGSGNWRREVHDIIDESRPAARLVVGETFNEPGCWSSYPPHKHDEQDPPREVRMQEVYYYRLDPAGGFGLQRIYSPERSFEESFAVRDGDAVLIPFGYHPVVAAGGYRLYYLWALCGEGRTLRPNEDPAHRWISEGVQGREDDDEGR